MWNGRVISNSSRCWSAPSRVASWWRDWKSSPEDPHHCPRRTKSYASVSLQQARYRDFLFHTIHWRNRFLRRSFRATEAKMLRVAVSTFCDYLTVALKCEQEFGDIDMSWTWYLYRVSPVGLRCDGLSQHFLSQERSQEIHSARTNMQNARPLFKWSMDNSSRRAGVYCQFTHCIIGEWAGDQPLTWNCSIATCRLVIRKLSLGHEYNCEHERPWKPNKDYQEEIEPATRWFKQHRSGNMQCCTRYSTRVYNARFVLIVQ